jgi:hypothetical protein
MVRPHRVQLLVAGLLFCILGSWRELIHVERVSATVAKERSSQERLAGQSIPSALVRRARLRNARKLINEGTEFSRIGLAQEARSYLAED